MPYDIRHDPSAGKFFIRVDGQEAFLKYSKVEEGKLDYRSTFVPPAGRGKGLGALLVEEGLTWAKKEGYKIVPSCSFVAAYIDASPKYADIRA